MTAKVGDMKILEEENATLKVDTQQLRVETAQLTQKVTELETEAEAISKAIQDDPLLRKLGGVRPSVGGSTANIPTSELSSTADGSLDALRERMDDLVREYQYLDDKTKRMRSTPTIWPLVGRIGSHFGGRLDPFTGDADTHLGIDISAPRGAPIKATADGIVHFARRASEYGNLIVLEHPNGFTTRYGHLSAFKVTEDQTVRKGDVIGYVGMTGRATAPHLHYEVRLNDRPVNPRPYLR